MSTVRELLRAAADLPEPSARRDVELLLGHCLNKPRSWLYTWPEKEIAPECVQRFERLLAQRKEGLPVAYLVGEREFWSLSLAVNSATLIPRPETETVVAWALELPLSDAAKVVDLGTGSGAIALAVASERPEWQVTAVDVSVAALEVARANAARAQLSEVSFVQSHWYQALVGQRYHLLLANPPYIDGADPHLDRGDLRFEPRTALVSRDGGLGDLAELVAGAAVQLFDGGWILLEHGFEQGPAVRTLLHKARFKQVTTRLDLAGLERVTGGCWHAE
jgi:release factor glutamine methyltransferase